MIQFWYHRYMLYPQNSLSALADETPREGLLFKMQWPDQKVGYADFFPWPELGDMQVDAQLDELRRGHISTLLEQTIWLARKDALLRAEKKNALTESMKIKNHFLVNDFTQITDLNLNEIKSAGFSTIKVKVGRSWKDEIEWINQVLRKHSFTCRLDFNSKGDPATFERMMSVLAPGLKQRIEFVEDPFPWDFEAWSDASKIAPLALDQEYKNVNWREHLQNMPFKVIVIKPARQDVEEAVKYAVMRQLKMVITSSMDHPVGIAHAVRVAAELKKQYTTQVLECGCLSVKSYKLNDFSTKMIIQGPYLTQIMGEGIGFDQVFQSLNWTPVQFDIKGK